MWAPDHPLVLYGLGQLQIWKNKLDKAKETFKFLNDLMPNIYEVMKILASLYTRVTNSSTEKEEARKLLEQVTAQYPQDIEAWIELAALLQEKHPKVSIL